MLRGAEIVDSSMRLAMIPMSTSDDKGVTLSLDSSTEIVIVTTINGKESQPLRFLDELGSIVQDSSTDLFISCDTTASTQGRGYCLNITSRYSKPCIGCSAYNAIMRET